MSYSSLKSLASFQKLFRELYISRDLSRGSDKTLLWLASELGELSDAYLKQGLSAMKEEVADVFAWLCSFCNLLDIDLEEAVLKKYGNGCPRCSSSPCRCPMR
ncbi:MAG: MazG nucleotide pyrophosphohydrolase domain-containing protein [Nitrososphaerota archaeon]